MRKVNTLMPRLNKPSSEFAGVLLALGVLVVITLLLLLLTFHLPQNAATG